VGAIIIFYNGQSKYHYRPAENYFDATSAVICFPDNYEPSRREGEGMARVTYMANYSQWKELNPSEYTEKKQLVSLEAEKLVKSFCPSFEGTLLFKDTFSPTTIERYTWHLNGAVYGSTEKTRDGRTPVKNLFIIGTDQGFLGIVGSMLSGISMANLHGLMGANE
jgi:phytoene dehydrogenase-like protein